MCSEVSPLVKFHPCGHSEVCEDCSVRIKKCLNCKVMMVMMTLVMIVMMVMTMMVMIITKFLK